MTDILKEAKDRFSQALQAYSAQIDRESDDLIFEFDPWPDDVKQQRAGQIVDGVPVPPRPMLSIPKLDQPVQLVINQEKAAHLGIQIHAVSEDANDDTAEMLQGLIRHIEVDSRASIARGWAFERATKAGRGAYRIDKVPADEGDLDGPAAFDQKIVIRRILNQGMVYLDPHAQEPDWSDGEWAFVGGFMSGERFQREFDKSALALDMGDEFDADGQDDPEWFGMVDGKPTVRVMEYWKVEKAERTKCAYRVNGKIQLGWLDELPEGFPKADILRKRVIETRTVKWYKLCGSEILNEEEWDGQYIPIIPTIGKEANIDGDRRWTGIIGPAKDGARLFNYGVSDAVEKTALATKAPWIMYEGQQEGHEDAWNQANVRNFPYLLVKPTTIGGQPAPFPQRNVQGPDISSAIALIEQADQFIHAATFTYDPSLGNTDSHRSGKAVLALQQQADAGHSHYLDNLAEVSMTYEAKVLLDLIPKVYDRPGRVARILGTDDEAERVILNMPFTQRPGSKGKPGQPVPVPQNGIQPYQGQPGQPQPKVKHFDLSKGKYSVTVTVGKAYQTRIQEGSDTLGQILQSEPMLMPILGPLWAKFQQWPGHEEAAELLKKWRAKQFPGMDDQDPSDPAQAQAQIGQLQGQLQHVTQAAQGMQKALETEQVKHQAQVQMKKVETSASITMQKMKDATSIAVAKINAAKGALSDAVGHDEAIALQEAEHEHETALAHAEAGHEQTMAELAQQHAQQMAEQQAQLGAQATDQQAGINADAADQGHQQTLEQQAQAAALAPQPQADGAGE